MHTHDHDPCPVKLTAAVPPLGDLSTRKLISDLLQIQHTGVTPLRLRVRGATLDDVRRELTRREQTPPMVTS